MAFEARGAGIGDRILRLSITQKSFETPSASLLVETGISDHDIHSATLAFDNDRVFLLGLAQLVYDDRAVWELTGCVAVDGFWIRKNVVHPLLAFRDRAARQDDSGPDVNPSPEVAGILRGFSPENDSERHCSQ